MMLYNPRDFDSRIDDSTACEEIAAGIEAQVDSVWFRWLDQPVRLVWISFPHVDPALPTQAHVRTWFHDIETVDLADLSVIDPDDEAEVNSLLCPICGGEGEIHPLNNPTGTRCPDCFGSGRFLHALR